MATYTNTLWVQSQTVPFGPTTLLATDNVTLNLATIVLASTVQMDLGTVGTMTTVKGSLTVDEDIYVTGNLVLSGATKVADLSPENVLIADNHLYLNNGYNTVVAQTGGLVVNTLPTTTTANVAATGFVAGVPAGVQPKVFVNGVGAILDVTMDTLILPQATIVVGDTTGFAASGTIYVTTTNGVEAVTYTAKTGTDFTGAAGGTGTMATGGFVSSLAFNVGDLVQVSGASDPANNGLFELLTNAGTFLTMRGIGTTTTVEDFTQNQFTADTTVAGAIRKVNVSVLRAGTDGVWRSAYGSASGLVFSAFSDPGLASTTNLTWTVNSDNAGENEDAALYLNSGDGSLMRQGQVTMKYTNSSDNGLNFGFDNFPAVTDYGFGFYFVPTNGGAASGATAGGQGGQFYYQGGSGGAAGAGAGLPGAGGPITLRAGTGGMGGAGATDGGTGGNANLEGGNGGMAAGGTAGYGGNATISGGLGASGTGSGASLTLNGGGGGNLGAAALVAKNIDIGATAEARAVNLGTGAAAQTVVVGSTTTTSATTINSGTGNLLLDANGNLIIFNGVLVGFSANAAENITAGDILYLLTDGTVGKADANAAGKKFVVGVAGNTDTTGNPIRVASIVGQVVTLNTDLSALNEGDVVYMSKTAGEVIADVSSYTASGDTIYRVGIVHTAAVAGTGKIIFMPQYLMTYA